MLSLLQLFCLFVFKERVQVTGTFSPLCSHLSCAHSWYFRWMLLVVAAVVGVRRCASKSCMGKLGVPGDISWLRNICIWRSYICRCFSSASVTEENDIFTAMVGKKPQHSTAWNLYWNCKHHKTAFLVVTAQFKYV